MENQPQFQSVLIVDDDQTLREMYEDYLKENGFSVLVARDGEEGLDQAKTSKPSAILLDLMMPKINGIEVLRRLKADPELKDIPVIVFTALIQDLEKQECFAAGAADYLVKTDASPKVIKEKIQTLISQEPQAQAPAAAAA